MTAPLCYVGRVAELRETLQRLAETKAGALATDEVGRRRYQRELARAALRSWVRQTLAGRWGGDAA